MYWCFSLHIKYIIELGRAGDFGFIRLNTTGKKNIVHLGNTMGDCCLDESDICDIKAKNLNGRKRRWHSDWKNSLDCRVSLVTYKMNLSSNAVIKEFQAPVCSSSHSIVKLFIYTKADLFECYFFENYFQRHTSWIGRAMVRDQTKWLMAFVVSGVRNFLT